MDGGTFYIHKKASKESAAQEFCIDGQFGSKTKGELYEGALHPTYEKARIVPYKKAITWILHETELKIYFAFQKAIIADSICVQENIEFNHLGLEVSLYDRETLLYRASDGPLKSQ